MELLGATETAKFIDKAVKLYEKGMGRSISIDGDSAATAGIKFAYTAEWEKLNQEYDALNESLDDLRLKYLHDNMAKFIEN